MATHLNPYLSFRDNARAGDGVLPVGVRRRADAQHVRRVPRQRGPRRGGQDHARAARHARTASSSWAPTRPTAMELAASSNISVSLSGEDEAELRGYWDKLADGATITVPAGEGARGATRSAC